ncbi:MAG: leucine-rich repeat domain-containing protein, partial [Muribaculaceae bacterium]|nr:leucine-rich repeat domain-containing protein [Muribaculaceae bacterium]
MKKLLLTLLGILSVLPILAQDFTFISENGVILTFSITNATAKTCAVKAPATTDVTTITLPSKAAYNGVSYTVTSIGDYAFQNCDKLTNIEIPGTISSIGRNAFDGCLILKKIDIPSSVTNINTYSFHNCKSLTSVTIPNTITAIGTWAFAGCSALETVILSPSVTTIAYSAFKECKSLKTVYIGPNVKSIGQDAFGNDPIQDVYITAQTIPTTGTGVFNKITDTATLHVQGDEQVVNLYKGAEHWSSFLNIVPITAPQSVAAFKTVSYDRYALSAGINSSSTYSLGMNLNEPISFNSCMVNANYQPLAGDINSSFWRSSNPAVAYVDADGMITLLEKPNNSNPPVITLESLYAGSPKIEFTISANDFSAEADGMTLHYIVLDEDKKTAAVTGASQSSKTVLSLPASVTSGGKQYSLAAISDIAFFESSLTQVTMPAPIVAIGKAAFKGCQALEAITLPYSLSSFGADAFYGCRALKAIQITCGIKSLPENTFHDCKALTDVKLDDFLTSVGSWAFAGCSNLTNIILPPSVTSVGASSFNECTKLNTVYMGPNIKNVYSNAFGKAPIQDLYITAQSLPSIGTGITVFNNLSKTATLHVQGDEQVVNLYKGAEHWSSFPNIV